MYQITTDSGIAPKPREEASVFSFLPDHLQDGNSSRRDGSRGEKRDYSSRGPRAPGFSKGPRSSGSFSKGGPKKFAGRPYIKKFDPKKGIDPYNVPVHLFINKEVMEAEATHYESKNKFEDFNLHPRLLQNLLAKDITTPSPIQDQAIPIAMEGRDLVGIASTGTGKTAAFLLPIIMKMVNDRDQKTLILCPTRELAFQVENEFTILARGLRLYSVAVVGGASLRRQLTELEKGVHIIIGTPGRVKDLIKRRKLNMNLFQTVVLDEADRMLDMGFIDDMREILSVAHPDRQTLFFSATFGSDEQVLCREFMKSPTQITLKSRDTAKSVAQDVVYVTHDDHKREAIKSILGKPHAKKVIIFREMKKDADALANYLKEQGFKVHALHGDMENRDRSFAVSDFAKGMVQAVVATDVAARGIDIPDVSLVVNYDLPQTYETYVHRIGRTGRGSKIGYALTFVPDNSRR